MQTNHHLFLEKTVPATEAFVSVIAGMIARDETSLAELYDATLSKVYGLALKITHRHDLAEEVVEDTLFPPRPRQKSRHGLKLNCCNV